MFRSILLICVLLSVICSLKCSFPDEGNALYWTVPQGKIVGAWKTAINGKQYASFQGIPYAKPPVGIRRFKAPEAAKPWQGVWNAKRLSNICLQYNQRSENTHPDTIKGDEDCLYLNVYTSNLESSANLSVIVYIHGGGFTFGSSAKFLPDFLMTRDVVVVTMNYRLGPLGFLTTEDEEAPGNNGLKDQNMALKWVRDNIKYFGGNPNSVSLTGMSAGGASVHFHMLSTLSKGLFHRAISQSGTALNNWSLQENALQKAMFVGEKLGCPTFSTVELIDCLEDQPAKAIVGVTALLMPWIQSPFSPFGPVVETINSKEAFITQHPLIIIKNGGSHDLPWIASTTTHEGLFPVANFLRADKNFKELEKRWDDVARYAFDFNLTVPLSMHLEVGRKIKDFYNDGEPFSMDTVQHLIKALGDRHFTFDIEKTVKLQSSIKKEPIYYYEFSYAGKTSMGKYSSGLDKFLGVSHGDDTAYIFKTIYLDPTTTPEDREMVDFMVEIFVSFANNGVPNVGYVPWKPVNIEGGQMNYLEISGPNRVSMKTTSDLSRSNGFWNTLGIRENEALLFSDKHEL